MQSVAWLGFGAHSAVSRTLVHFFPFSSSVGAPYATECRLTLFGSGAPARTVALDGARLGQPDGLRLEDAFPELASGAEARFFGLQIELESSQPRVDLSASACFIEFVRPGASSATAVRYRPMVIGPSGTAAAEGASTPPFVVVDDQFQKTSFVVVNRSTQAVQPVVRSHGGENGGGWMTLPFASVAAGAVEEFQFESAVVDGGLVQECSWGRCATRALDVVGPPPEVAYFALRREPDHRRPISVNVV